MDKISLCTEFLVYFGKIKGSETVFRLILFDKKLIFHENNTPAFHYGNNNVAA